MGVRKIANDNAYNDEFDRKQIEVFNSVWWIERTFNHFLSVYEVSEFFKKRRS
jgi:hypothetical protein